MLPAGPQSDQVLIRDARYQGGDLEGGADQQGTLNQNLRVSGKQWEAEWGTGLWQFYKPGYKSISIAVTGMQCLPHLPPWVGVASGLLGSWIPKMPSKGLTALWPLCCEEA